MEEKSSKAVTISKDEGDESGEGENNVVNDQVTTA